MVLDVFGSPLRARKAPACPRYRGVQAARQTCNTSHVSCRVDVERRSFAFLSTGTRQSGWLSTVAGHKCVLTRRHRGILYADDCSPNLWRSRALHSPALRSWQRNQSKNGRQATRVWNLFGTFQNAVNTLGFSASGKSSNFQGVGWWAHQGSNLGPAD